jgi:hypothetical protein
MGCTNTIDRKRWRLQAATQKLSRRRFTRRAPCSGERRRKPEQRPAYPRGTERIRTLHLWRRPLANAPCPRASRQSQAHRLLGNRAKTRLKRSISRHRQDRGAGAAAPDRAYQHQPPHPRRAIESQRAPGARRLARGVGRSARHDDQGGVAFSS